MSTHRPCKKCGEPIHFVPTPQGKLMPCELNIVTIITTNGRIEQGYIPHWDKCPGADEVRKEVVESHRSHATNQLHIQF